MSTWSGEIYVEGERENRHLLFQGDIGGDVGEGEVGVAGVEGEGVVYQGVMLVRARYFATCQ